MECFLWYPLVFAFNNQIFFIITHFHAPNFIFKKQSPLKFQTLTDSSSNQKQGCLWVFYNKELQQWLFRSIQISMR